MNNDVSVSVSVEQMEDWESLDATREFKERLNKAYQKVVDEGVSKNRGDSRDSCIDTARGIKLAIRELEQFIEEGGA